MRLSPLIPHLLALLLTAGGWLWAWPEPAPNGPKVDWDQSGHALRIEVPSLGPLNCHWQAEIQQGSQEITLHSQNTSATASRQLLADGASCCMIPYSGVQLLFRWNFDPTKRLLTTQAGVRNTGPEAIRLKSLSPLMAKWNPPTNRTLGWLTGLHPQTPLALQFDEPPPPVRIHEYGTFYLSPNVGWTFGPVGEPITWLNHDWDHDVDGTHTFHTQGRMDLVRVDPGETRWGQALGLVFDQPHAALETWAKEVAQSHRARNHRPALTGWNNWNYLEKKDINRELLDLTEVVRKSEHRLRPAVIQTDYNAADTELRATLTDPKLADHLKRVRSTGAEFGCMIGSSAGGWGGIDNHATMVETLRQVAAAGFGYVKLFYPPRVASPGERTTQFENYRAMLLDLRAAVGDSLYLMFCDYEPNRAAVGIVDSSRVGPDAKRDSLRGAIPAVLRALPLNRHWFVTDPDTYFIGTDIANISQVQGNWPLVRTWLSMVGMNCGTAITSDPWYWDDFKPLWRNVEVLTPPANERTNILEVGTSNDWSRLIGHVRRPWGNHVVALLWNEKTTEDSVTLDFAKAGMRPDQRYAVWSFWDDRYLGVAERSWTSTRLSPGGSQHLVFTPLNPHDDRPVVIGSNLHIYCGAAEIQEFSTARERLTVKLSDAGARSGDLYLYSRWQPVLEKTVACSVGGITSAGENVWRVSLYGRNSGSTQEIRMRVLLPVTRQWWFWGLIATAIGGVLFGAWRYLVAVRLQRARLLDQERARIARDIHDDLGASLTHLALLGELAKSHADEPTRLTRHVEDLFRASQKLARSVDEIVWALNPANDTVANVAAYVGDMAQEYLQPAGIRCKLEFPPSLPSLHLPPKVRHQLFLVIKECLHNVVAHSRATMATIQIDVDFDRLRVIISDDGCGFDPQQPRLGRPGGGHGLKNIRQRIEDVEGSLSLQSAPGKGTIVTLEVNL